MKEQYKAVRKIVKPKIDSYDMKTRYMLQDYNMRMISIDLAITKLQENPSSDQASKVLDVILAAISAGAKVAPMVL